MVLAHVGRVSTGDSWVQEELENSLEGAFKGAFSQENQKQVSQELRSLDDTGKLGAGIPEGLFTALTKTLCCLFRFEKLQHCTFFSATDAYLPRG